MLISLMAQKKVIEPKPVTNASRLKELKGVGPAPFAGSSNPLDANRWISEMELAFDLMGCENDEKVTLATHHLQGRTVDWWHSCKRMLGGDEVHITWKMFKEAFEQQHFPEAIRMQMEREFYDLNQGSMTMIEYE